EFPPFALTVWSPEPSTPWELAVLRAAGALRAMSAVIGDASLVNRVVQELRTRGDFTLIPAPTNHPGGWRSYAAMFAAVDALVTATHGEPLPLRLPDTYSAQDLARDRAITEFVPDLSTGMPRLEDVLVAVEFVRTTWPVMVNQNRGRFLL